MRVLAVDDHEDVRELLLVALSTDGIDVKLASSGPDALSMIESDVKPDLVLLDIQMPDMDGWEVLDRIRLGATGNPDLPVVLCTVKASFADTERAWRAGCDGYVTKPFHIDRLLGEVRAVAKRSPSERTMVRASALEALHRFTAQTQTAGEA